MDLTIKGQINKRVDQQTESDYWSTLAEGLFTRPRDKDRIRLALKDSYLTMGIS